MSKRARRKMQRKLKSLAELHEIAVDPKFFDAPPLGIVKPFTWKFSMNIPVVPLLLLLTVLAFWWMAR